MAVFWLIAPAAGASGLPPAIAQSLERQGVPASAASLWVGSLDGKPLFTHEIDRPRNPASVMKLVTSLASLEILGPTYSWKTQIHAFAPVENGVLKGDLYIRGGGDPFLVSEEVWKLAGALRRLGIQTIQGDLVFDLSLFDLAPEDPGAFDGQRFRAYNQPPHALLMNFNALRFEFRPDREGRSVWVTTDPPMSNLRLENRLRLEKGSCGRFQAGVNYHVAGPSIVRLEGSFPANCPESSLLRTALSPEAYAHGLFKELWSQWGGDLKGGWRLGALPDPRSRPLHVHRSPPLSELMRSVNKSSNNVMARHFKLAAGLERFGPPATLDKGNRAIQEYLLSLSGDMSGIVMNNAAGLSRTNRISARQVARVLQAGRASPYAPEYLSSLAVAGLDGTLQNRFVNTALTGRMRLKTGYVDSVSTVAGYMQTASGRELIVVWLLNHPGIGYQRGVDIQDMVLRWVFENA